MVALWRHVVARVVLKRGALAHGSVPCQGQEIVADLRALYDLVVLGDRRNIPASYNCRRLLTHHNIALTVHILIV